MSTASETSQTSTHNRSHNQGRQDRNYTNAQLAAVERVRKCKITDYYSILDIESPSSDIEIRKSYRKLALIMHPDKNGAPGSDEAFKMVSKAFQILSDPDKKRIFDQTGSDPESRASAAADAFAGRGGGGMGGGAYPGMFTSDISPEEIFNMFFSGMGGGGTHFQFGNVHTSFGGPGSPFTTFRTDRRRAPGATAQQAQQRAEDFSLSNLLQLLPLFFLIIMPLIMSLFGDSGSSSSSYSNSKNVNFKFDSTPPYTEQRSTPNYKIPFYVRPDHVGKLSKSGLRKLDNQAEVSYIRKMNNQCAREQQIKQQAIQDSKGWFFVDQDKYDAAMDIEMPACDKLDQLGVYYRQLL